MRDDAEARAADRLAAWDAQGIHRTATKGDEAGADWLIGEAIRLGVAPCREEFALDRLDPVSAYLEIDGSCIAGVPVFDAPATDADGILGKLRLRGRRSHVRGRRTVASFRIYFRLLDTPAAAASRPSDRLPGAASRAWTVECRAFPPALRCPDYSNPQRSARGGPSRCGARSLDAARRRQPSHFDSRGQCGDYD